MRWQPVPSLLVLMSFAVPSQAQFLGKSTAAWAKDLESGNDKTRRGAAFALGKLGGQAVPAMAALERALLQDPNPQVREAAAFAIGEISQRSAAVAKGVAP